MDKQKELLKNTAIIAVGKICTQFMSFLLLPLYTSVLSTEEYGTVDLFVTYTSLLLPVVLFQVDQALFRFLIDARGDREKSAEVISTAVFFALAQSLSLTAVFSLVQFFVTSPYQWLLLLNILASVFSNMALQLARGFGDNITYSLGSFLSAFFQIAGNIVFLLPLSMGVYGMLWATILSHFLTGLFVFVRERLHRYLAPSFFRKPTLKQILRYSLPLVPNALCWWALNASDRVIVLFFLGRVFNGLLSVGHKLSSVYIMIYNLFNLSWTESASLHMNDADRDAFFQKVILKMFDFFMCLGIALIAFIPLAFPLLVNAKFAEAYALIPAFVIASMFNVVVGLYSVIYVALRKTNEIAKTSLFAGIINVLSHLALIRWIGLFAAPVSTLIAFASMALFRYFDIQKYMSVKLNPYKVCLYALWTAAVVVTYFMSSDAVHHFMFLLTGLLSVHILYGKAGRCSQ